MDLPIPIIIAGFMIAIGAIALSLFRFRFAALIIMGMTVFGSIAVQREEGRIVNATFIQPIQLLRAELFLGGAIVLLLACLANAPKMRLSVLPAQAVLFLLIHLYAGLLRMAHGGSIGEGAESMAFALICFVPLIIAVPALLAEREGWYSLLRAIGFAGAIWCALTFVQFAINRREILTDFGRRLAGMHGQPQAVSQFLCFIATIAVWLVLDDPKRSLRLFWMGLAGVSLVLIAWTGSRSGAIMAMIGLAFVLYARLGRAALLLPIFGGVVFAVFTWLGDMVRGLGVRLTDVTDTRSKAWGAMLDQFMNDPFFGSGIQKSVENSYLLGLAAYGVFMGVLLLSLLLATGLVMRKVWAGRKALTPEFQRWVWLVLGVNAMYFIGANADGFILARLEATHVIILVFAGFGVALARMSVGRWPMVDGPFWEETPAYDDGGVEMVEGADGSHVPEPAH